MFKGNLNRGQIQAKTKRLTGPKHWHTQATHNKRMLKEIFIEWMAFISSLAMQFRVDNSFNEKSNNRLLCVRPPTIAKPPKPD